MLAYSNLLDYLSVKYMAVMFIKWYYERLMICRQGKWGEPEFINARLVECYLEGQLDEEIYEILQQGGLLLSW